MRGLDFKDYRLYLGTALVIAVVGLTIGGIISAFTGSQISDSAITAVTALVSTIVGGLIGHGATLRQVETSSEEQE